MNNALVRCLNTVIGYRKVSTVTGYVATLVKMSAKNEFNQPLRSDEELLQENREIIDEIRQTRRHLEVLEQKIADNLETLKNRLKRESKINKTSKIS